VERVRIAEIGIEGGGRTVYGRQSHGIWSFWAEGTSMDLDENDDEVWRAWTSEPVPDLALVLPRDWSLFHPGTIHPDFLGWFRRNYDAARQIVPEHLRRYQAEHPHHSWLRVLGLASPP
jgi:hypothetical protein